MDGKAVASACIAHRAAIAIGLRLASALTSGLPSVAEGFLAGTPKSTLPRCSRLTRWWLGLRRRVELALHQKGATGTVLPVAWLRCEHVCPLSMIASEAAVDRHQITPAYAGNTPGSGPTSGPASDHPRIRGDGRFVSQCLPALWRPAPSPCVRRGTVAARRARPTLKGRKSPLWPLVRAKIEGAVQVLGALSS